MKTKVSYIFFDSVAVNFEWNKHLSSIHLLWIFVLQYASTF